jgi:restriction endonuclease S subunit
LGALKANNKDSAFTFLNPKTLKALRIPIPPIGLQEEYRLITQKVEKQVSTAASQLEGFNALLSSLSQRAFRGEL